MTAPKIGEIVTCEDTNGGMLVMSTCAVQAQILNDGQTGYFREIMLYHEVRRELSKDLRPLKNGERETSRIPVTIKSKVSPKVNTQRAVACVILASLTKPGYFEIRPVEDFTD